MGKYLVAMATGAVLVAGVLALTTIFDIDVCKDCEGCDGCDKAIQDELDEGEM